MTMTAVVTAVPETRADGGRWPLCLFATAADAGGIAYNVISLLVSAFKVG